MKVSKKSISVVLPNYNGKNLLELYLPSLFEALIYSKLDYEIIVIDDCSVDDSVDFISKKYPEIKQIQNKKNKGFSYTCNQGIKKASKDLVFLLNSDVKLTPNYFEAQLNYFEDTNTFGVMGCILNFDGLKIEDAARIARFKIFKFKANQFYYIDEPNAKVFTTYLSGANALIDREKLLKLNGFNEIYSPFYFEDFDLGLRAWKAGWKLYYEHKSKCFHRVSASTNLLDKSNSVKIIYHRNSMLLQVIHLTKTRKIFWFIQLFTINMFSHLIIKRDFWFLESVYQFMKMQSEIKKSRLEILKLQHKNNVNISLSDIIKFINETIKNKIINRI